MDEASARFRLPMLQAGQAQKEVLHNEALARIDALLHPLCESFGDDVPPATRAEGQSWIVGSAPVGDWAGQADALASWTAGGWRFVRPAEGLAVRVRGGDMLRRFGPAGWGVGMTATTAVQIEGVQVVGERQAAITAPAGGATVDTQARGAVTAVLEALRTHGLIAR